MISTLSNFTAKRPPKMNLFSVNVFLQILLMLIIIVTSSRADANRHQTNKNDISNLFNQEIEDRQGLDKFLENSKKQAESGVGNKAGLQELGTNEGELENKTSELNAIQWHSVKRCDTLNSIKLEC